MFVKDLVERTVATYAQAFLGLLLASWSDAIDVSTDGAFDGPGDGPSRLERPLEGRVHEPLGR
jgi:hypothetical protein